MWWWCSKFCELFRTLLPNSMMSQLWHRTTDNIHSRSNNIDVTLTQLRAVQIVGAHPSYLMLSYFKYEGGLQTPCPVKAKLFDKYFVCRTTMVGPTGEDEMCNFYMMYWVEGKDTIQPNTCFTRWNRWGCTMMAWTKDPIVTQGTTHLVLGRSGSAGAWSRPWKHSWPWSFRPIKDLASGMASMACKSSRSDASHGKPLGTNMKCEYRQGWFHRPSYQAAPLLWPELLIS